MLCFQHLLLLILPFYKRKCVKKIAEERIVFTSVLPLKLKHRFKEELNSHDPVYQKAVVNSAWNFLQGHQRKTLSFPNQMAIKSPTTTCKSWNYNISPLRNNYHQNMALEQYIAFVSLSDSMAFLLQSIIHLLHSLTCICALWKTCYTQTAQLMCRLSHMMKILLEVTLDCKRYAIPQ